MRVRAKITREIADFIMSEYTLLKSKGVNLRKTTEIINSCLHEISVSKKTVFKYGNTPFKVVKAKHREYYQRPEVKARMREYSRERYQRPEVKARRREYMKKLVKPRNENIEMNIDVFTDLGVELTLREVWEKVGGNYLEVCRNLSAYCRAGVLKKGKRGGKTTYRLNPDSPLHVIADGLFEDKSKKLDEQFRR